ncbi:hypothetical protein GCM10010885_13280 [Alicyclobacillus cellulosilyticus]|uniref:Uncharacterized protein n=1 Tax=Alicyclobacillus cellulosilyticus TaxID=1003997 RepID=A0A917KC18_9BACL|nr:hypothetical protein [Alicyclobacillus cellulosilyticus]GGJ05494.1 hypothetical protein GCM10010885_13280 [Alicyclobacillus cellulosilyticus]
MLCPHCGPHGQMVQVSFSPEYEHYQCTVCHITYVVYPLGDGEFTEPVPVAPEDGGRGTGPADPRPQT